ncbi:SWIM zinc finger family protein [Streptomyces sp. NPDC026672]|uniref:SWIM zinc finger family protein n=1 Tax=unclassified Streptomyces TaxID=2593676 RepID=UPI0033F9EDCA
MSPRPGDVARAALRSAVSARRGGAEPTAGEKAGTDTDPTTGPGTDPATGSVAGSASRAPSPPHPPAAGTPRPSEAAREALRSARREARAETAGTPAGAEAGETPGAPARTEGRGRTGTRGTKDRHGQTAAPASPSAPTANPGPGPGPGSPARPTVSRTGAAAAPVARGRSARDMRELLAGALRMPEKRDEPTDSGTGRTGDAAGEGRAAGAGSAAGTEPSPPWPAAEPRPAGEARPRADAQPRSDLRPRADVEPPADLRPRADAQAPADSQPRSGVQPPADPKPADPQPPADPRRPADPRVPLSMAAPRRDGELRRTFRAFPARAGDVAEAAFAETWWGNAWVDALERGALDVKRLVRGRAYAQQGHVDAITVTPGLVLAYVRGSRPRPYRVQVRLRTLPDDGWARFLDAAVERPGHIAALLDKELPQSLADCGVPLLPGPGDLDPRCSCPDSGHPCKHAAALCYQTARLLDADPFVLLLLRGRGERDLLDALSRRNAAAEARAAQDKEPAPLPGVRAAEALGPRRLPPLPPPLPAPPHPGHPPAYPAAPGGPDPFALDQLATDAAARAHTLLTTGHDPVGGLTLWQDAVRLAAARPGSGLTAGTRALYSSLAAAVGRTPSELARAVAAWRQGGLDGLTVLEEPWDPPAGRFDRARPLLLAADLPVFRPWRNRLTHPAGHVQLRLGQDGLWYAYESEPNRDDWWPRGTPDLDPVGALTGLGLPGDT